MASSEFDCTEYMYANDTGYWYNGFKVPKTGFGIHFQNPQTLSSLLPRVWAGVECKYASITETIEP